MLFDGPNSVAFFVASGFLSSTTAAAVFLLTVCVLMVFARRFVHKTKVRVATSE